MVCALPFDVLCDIFVWAQRPSLARLSRAFHAASRSAGVRARYCLVEFGRSRVLDSALGLPARRPRMARPDVVLLLLAMRADPRADDQWVLRHACARAGPWTPIVRTVLRMRRRPSPLADHGPDHGLDCWRGGGSAAAPAAPAAADDGAAPLVDVHDGDDLALRIAAGCGHTAVVHELLDAGADISVLLGEPLVLAAANAHSDTVRVLLARGADASADHARALRSAVLPGDANADAVCALLDAGADVRAVDDSCLLAACWSGDGAAPPPAAPPAAASRAALLTFAAAGLPTGTQLRAAAAATTAAATSALPRHAAPRRYARHAPRAPASHVGLVRLLLERGADANARHGCPLAYACARGSLRTSAVLLAFGADPRARGDEPLRAAAERGHAAILRLLVTAGADVTADAGAALFSAARGGHAAAVRELLALGASVRGAAGASALRAAARGCWVQIVLELLAAGADADDVEFRALAQRSRALRDALGMSPPPPADWLAQQP
ncbi:hypothetical protein H4R26_002582 [Coemansia thaxteri]|uniref:Ankyrin repeat protein n=1 Tax=Coemansia thaxteri TaxID=2663907 RepID=A0A9W8BJJ5_9FUNG|nr:hypothetical protein H4R26_002582 [Coemansia thaxteri]KAJ2484830.1 hypothetical protein EV174_002131 [Coemansia sp. RSA 2320]